MVVEGDKPAEELKGRISTNQSLLQAAIFCSLMTTVILIHFLNIICECN